MVLPATPLYRQALARPHQPAFHVTSTDIYGTPLTRDVLGAPATADIPTSGGSVTANLTNRVTRRANFNVADTWYPLTATDPLAPETAVISISAGLRYGDGTEELFPLFKGRVADVRRDDDGTVTVQCDDLGADVVAYRFEQIWKVKNPASCLAEIQAIILDALPQAQFTEGDAIDAPVPPDLSWDEDRGKALDDLAAAMGARWYALGDGTFTVRAFPYSIGDPVAVMTDGTDGLISHATIRRTRDGAANSITVIAERAGGTIATAPVRQTSRDTSASSPTRFGGPYGKVSQIIKVQTPLTDQQAKALSDAQVLASVAMVNQWDIRCVPDYSLEPADAIQVTSLGINALQVIDSISYPLTAQADQSIGGRAYVSPDVTLAS
ncbi:MULTISPECIES: DUF5047 domain-containing protein [unclassified Streptomyces]|uniref:DUF5047 domain-containing protein n=1 Tax=unclassified Streptomyces TaxID=2593676 RepID=UPI00081F0EEC|nr:MULTISPECIES: DUF5047 domain-containing protein [unclassified Streptomyces]MYZ35471.1 DUF5047 domain-containing protein [Streptomyces sp. SID4917]SCF75745.1 protein of unknown function [Streptomyces sp. MnatMP-M17]